MPNIALISAGFIGRVHAQCIVANPDTRLAAVHDLDASAAAALAERHGARVAGSVGEIVGDDDTDAVVIASSTDSRRFSTAWSPRQSRLPERARCARTAPCRSRTGSTSDRPEALVFGPTTPQVGWAEGVARHGVSPMARLLDSPGAWWRSVQR